MSSSRLIMTGSPAGGRTTASAVPAFIAWSCWRMPLSSLGVLSVEHDPGKARPGDHLGDDIAAEASPQPDLALVCPQRRLESVPIRLRDDVGVHACLPC